MTSRQNWRQGGRTAIRGPSQSYQTPLHARVRVSRQRGEEGTAALVQDAAGDERVQLFFQLVRGCSQERIAALVGAILAKAEKAGSVQHVVDLFVMAFQTRNCRGGKGEKMLFYALMKELLLQYPKAAFRVAELIPQYGYYKDWFAMGNYLQAALKANPTNELLESVLRQWIDYVVTACSVTLKKDGTQLSSIAAKAGDAGIKKLRQNGLSQLGKYLPKAQSTKQKRRQKQIAAATSAAAKGRKMSSAEELATFQIRWYNMVAKRMFGQDKASMRLRQLLTALRAALNVTESLMSTNRWGEIDFGRVASLCMMRNRQVFFRRCSAGLHRAMLQKRVNASRLFPHEIAQKLLDDTEAAYLCEVLGEPVARLLTSDEKQLFELQWEKIREDVHAKILEKQEQERLAADLVTQAGASKQTMPRNVQAVPLTNIVPIVDMSGSMHGTPVAVAVAFGILLSELVECEHYRNRVLTFAAYPEWYEFSKSHTTLEQKIKAIKSIQGRCGDTTNVGLAFDRILAVAVAQKLTQQQLPELVIFSDMQFTDATGGVNWQTEYEKTRAKFAQGGYEVPMLTFWNLRSVESGDGSNGGVTGAMPVDSAMPGVRLLSGYSPHLMKALLNGEIVEEEVDEDEPEQAKAEAGADAGAGAGAEAGEDDEQVRGSEGEAKVQEPAEIDVAQPSATISGGQERPVPTLPTAKKVRIDTLATLRKTLDDPAYNDVRTVLSTISEKLLQPVATAGGMK